MESFINYDDEFDCNIKKLLNRLYGLEKKSRAKPKLYFSKIISQTQSRFSNLSSNFEIGVMTKNIETKAI